MTDRTPIDNFGLPDDVSKTSADEAEEICEQSGWFRCQEKCGKTAYYVEHTSATCPNFACRTRYWQQELRRTAKALRRLLAQHPTLRIYLLTIIPVPEDPDELVRAVRAFLRYWRTGRYTGKHARQAARGKRHRKRFVEMRRVLERAPSTRTLHLHAAAVTEYVHRATLWRWARASKFNAGKAVGVRLSPPMDSWGERKIVRYLTKYIGKDPAVQKGRHPFQATHGFFAGEEIPQPASCECGAALEWVSVETYAVDKDREEHGGQCWRRRPIKVGPKLMRPREKYRELWTWPRR